LLSTFAVHLLRNRAANLPDLGIDPAAIRSILFVELTRMGDVISAFTAVDSLRSHFPHARSAMMVCDRYEELVRVALPGIDVIGIRNVPPFAGEIRGVTEARRRAADLLLSLGPGRRNGLVALLSGSPRIAGYLECVAGSVPFLRENSVEGWGFRPAALEVRYGNEPHALRALKVGRVRSPDAQERERPTGAALCECGVIRLFAYGFRSRRAGESVAERFVVGRVLVPDPYVLGDRRGEQVPVLGEVADASRGRDLARHRRDEPQHRCRQRRLPDATRTYDRDALPGVQVEGNIVETARRRQLMHLQHAGPRPAPGTVFMPERRHGAADHHAHQRVRR